MDSNIVDTPEEGPETPGEKLDVATEYAFDALIKKALSDRLLPPVLQGAEMGLMYLPQQEVT